MTNNHRKPLVVRKIQIETSICFHLIIIGLDISFSNDTISVGKVMDKSEYSYPAGKVV
jgi:hypothetical protein